MDSRYEFIRNRIKVKKSVNNKYVFVADFFANEVPGGGELNNDELIKILRHRGHEVATRKSILLDAEEVDKLSGSRFIVANFVGLPEQWKKKNI